MTVKIELCEKMGFHKSAYAFALRESSDLIDAGFLSWTIAWDDKAILALIDGRCIGFIQYAYDKENPYLVVEFAAIHKDYRKGGQVFILLIARLRDLCQSLSVNSVRFSYHPNNKAMQHAARILGGQIRSVNVECTIPESEVQS